MANGKDKNEVPNALEFGQLNAFLAHQNYTPAQRKVAVGDKVDNRTRGAIAADLKRFTKGE